MKNEIIKYKENKFIIKIKQTIYRIVQKIWRKSKENNNKEDMTREKISNIKEKKDTINFVTNIQVDRKIINNVVEKKEFLREIDNNPEIIKKLTIGRLLILEKYYNDIIINNEKILQKLQSKA